MGTDRQMTDSHTGSTGRRCEKQAEDITQLGDDSTVSKAGKFRLSARQVHATYKTHLDKAKFAEFLRSLCSSTGEVDELYMAHESGDDFVPYPHTHVVWKLGFTPNWKNARKLDFNDIHPHIQVLKTKAHWDNAVRYLAKEDPANKHLKDYRTRKPHEKIDPSKTLKENIEASELPVKSYYDIKLIHEAKTMDTFTDRQLEVAELYMKNIKDRYILKPEDLYKWQKSLMEILEEPCTDTRTIHWYYDKKGRVGKSAFFDFVEDYFGPVALCLNGVGVGDQHALFAIKESITNKTWKQGILMINLVRNELDHKTTYNIIEKIKDGKFTSTKYKALKVTLDHIPHVVVFANKPPNLKDSLSEDRWRIIEIRPNDCTKPEEPFIHILDRHKVEDQHMTTHNIEENMTEKPREIEEPIDKIENTLESGETRDRGEGPLETPEALNIKRLAPQRGPYAPLREGDDIHADEYERNSDDDLTDDEAYAEAEVCSEDGTPSGDSGFALDDESEKYIEYIDGEETVMIPVYVAVQHMEMRRGRIYWKEGSDLGEGEVEDEWIEALQDAQYEGIEDPEEQDL